MELYIEILGTIIGCIYLWLEYKANIYLWVVSIIMPAIYLYVFYNAGLYADFAINIYYLLIAIYGWFVDQSMVLSILKRMILRRVFLGNSSLLTLT